MADKTIQEKLQPSLLDRLTDQHPSRQDESRDERLISQHELRQAVLRDLKWLLNTINFESIEDISGFDEIHTSVLNYGLPDFSGRTRSTVDTFSLEKKLRRMIESFEPRILKNTLKIVFLEEDDGDFNNTVIFEIRGSLWGQPMPQELYLKTELDLELGDVSVVEE